MKTRNVCAARGEMDTQNICTARGEVSTPKRLHRRGAEIKIRKVCAAQLVAAVIMALATGCSSGTAASPAPEETDILVAAIGKAGMITPDFVKPGATVIDVGTTLVDGRLVGDVDFQSALEVAGAITPVPGGVGPVTNIALLRNVVKAAERAGR